MNIAKRSVALGLVFSVLFSITACKPKKKVEELIVKKDDPWYESNRVELNYEVSSDTLVTGTSLEYSDNKIFMIYSAYDMVDYVNSTHICTYDENGNNVGNVELQYDGDGSIIDVHKIIPEKDGNTATALATLFTSGITTSFMKVDLASGKVTETIEAVDADGINTSNGGMAETMFQAGPYYGIVSMKEENMSKRVHFYKGTEFVSEMDTGSLGIIGEISNMVYDEKDSKIHINMFLLDAQKYLTCIVDPATGAVVKTNEWNDEYMRTDNASDYTYSNEGELLRIDSLGNIYKMDPEKGESSVVVSNSAYSPYFYDFTEEKNPYGRRVLSRTDDKVVMGFIGVNQQEIDLKNTLTVTILKKAETNPHEGKKVIEISMPSDGYFSDYLSMAIDSFNRTDKEYLVRIWSKHNTGFKPGFNYPAGFAIDQNYSLVLELKSDECPDLVLDVQKLDAMKDEMLVDLSEYLDQDAKSALFANVLEASKVNGKSYVLPITLKIEGIIANEELAGKDKAGFTFEEYDAFVNGALNGAQAYDYVDSKYNNREAFVESCLDVKAAIEGEKVNFDSEQFRKAAEYAKDHFHETSYTATFDNEGERNRPVEEGKYVIMKTIYDFIMGSNTSDPVYTIYGTPSVNAAGPRFTSAECISVAARSDEKDGCRKFLNYLFAGSFVPENANLSSIPSNKKVMESQATKLLENNNALIDELAAGVMQMESLYSLGYKKVDAGKTAANFIDAISKMSIYYIDEPEITKIVMEELAPYYAGDRSIDDSIKYINDRVSKFVNEAK